MGSDTRTNDNEYMTASEAREYLGVSKPKMAKLLADGELPYEVDPLDRRIRLIKRADVAALASRSIKKVAA